MFAGENWLMREWEKRNVRGGEAKFSSILPCGGRVYNFLE
jgi:hypothetical protein